MCIRDRLNNSRRPGGNQGTPSELNSIGCDHRTFSSPLLDVSTILPHTSQKRKHKSAARCTPSAHPHIQSKIYAPQNRGSAVLAPHGASGSADPCSAGGRACETKLRLLQKSKPPTPPPLPPTLPKSPVRVALRAHFSDFSSFFRHPLADQKSAKNRRPQTA